MNEELRIIIRAVTNEARRNMAAVREELERIQTSGEEGGKTVDNAMKTVAKGAALAVGAITALTTAMTALGRRAQDVQKGFDKLNTTFLNAGSSTAQASQTYKELFSFLGEHDKAVETAQSLALMVSEEQDLAQWTNILQGAFAEMGEKLPIEGLAEAANETMNTGVVVGVLADALNWAGVSEDAFNEALANTNSLAEREALIRDTLNSLYGNSAKIYDLNNQATKQYNESQAELNLTLAQAASYTTPLLTSLNQLSTSLLTFFAPALQTVAVYLTAFIQLISEAIVWVGSFFGMFSSKAETVTADVNGYRTAVENYQNSLRNAFGGTNAELDTNLKKINAVKKATMGFDELNIVSSPAGGASASPSIGGGAGGAISLPKAPSPSDYGIGTGVTNFEDMAKSIAEAKEKLEVLLPIVGLIGAGFLGWKVYDFFREIKTLTEGLATVQDLALRIGNEGFEAAFGAHPQRVMNETENRLKSIKSKVGGVLVILGLTVASLGAVSAITDGLKLGNMAALLGGLATAIGGVYLMLGPLAASIGVVVAGVALMVVGVIDFIKQGPTLQNTILIIGGTIAVAVGLATAGVSVLISVIIAAVAAIAAFTAAILLEKPAIMSVEEAQEALTEAKNRAVEAENSYISAVDGAEAALKRLEEAEKAAGITGEELYKQVQDGVLDYADMTDAQKEVYKAYLDNEKKQQDLKTATEELNKAKKDETLASFENQLALAKESGSYDEFKKSVVAAFEAGEISADEARELIGKSMSEMSDDAQQTFMEDLPDSIKTGLEPSQYETTRKKIGDWFKKVGKGFIENIWQPVKDFWNQHIKPIFTKEWWSTKFNAIKDGAKAALNGVIGAVESAINWIIKKINTLSWKVPDWVPKIGGDTFGFNFKLVSIPRLATGGIVTSSILANIGERGREAVLPLENNTGWMDTLADRIAARNSSPSKVVLMVDGKELGYATINSINSITRQTGNLQLITI